MLAIIRDRQHLQQLPGFLRVNVVEDGADVGEDGIGDATAGLQSSEFVYACVVVQRAHVADGAFAVGIFFQQKMPVGVEGEFAPDG